jgi:hypothetical protein
MTSKRQHIEVVVVDASQESDCYSDAL